MSITALRRTAVCAVFVLALCASVPAQVGTVTDLGLGCGDPVPTLTMTPPAIGAVATVSVTGAWPYSFVMIGISDAISPPYPYFGPCQIAVDLGTLQIIPLGYADANGSFQLSVALPFDPSLVGITRNVQVLVEAPLEGKSLSNALQFTIGFPPPDCQFNQASISSNFNGTSIAAGGTIWFNAIVKSVGIPATGGFVHFDASTIEFTASGVPYLVNVPSSMIVYDPLATTAETHFDVGTGEWHTTVPAGYTGNVFLSGVGFPVSPALPGGINPVTWTGSFATNVPGVSFQWKWAAAVYTSFSSDPNAVGAKPVDGNSLSIYANSDHAGTPEAFKAFVTGGARGGGGSNFTGSYSGTQTEACQ